MTPRIVISSGQAVVGDAKVLSEIRHLCGKVVFRNRDLEKNYSWDNWEINSCSLAHALIEQKRFDAPIGQFHLVYLGQDLIGFAGANPIDDKTYVCLARSLMVEEYRNHQYLGALVLPLQLEFARKQGYLRVWLTFNDYNKPLFHALSRIADKKTVLFGQANAEAYQKFHPLEGTRVVQGVDQHIMELIF